MIGDQRPRPYLQAGGATRCMTLGSPIVPKDISRILRYTIFHLMKRKMPRGLNKGSEYVFLQMKYARENKLKEAAAHRTQARVVENYTCASNRNNLEVEKQNIKSSVQRMPPGMRQYYLDYIN